MDIMSFCGGFGIQVFACELLLAFPGGEGSGLGTGDFAVSNGKAFLAFSLEPNDFVLTIKDLDVGVQEFYRESKTFSVKGQYLILY